MFNTLSIFYRDRSTHKVLDHVLLLFHDLQFQVSSIVPKIPKIPVEELLMLEGPKSPSDAKGSASKTIQGLDLHQQGPLPPIPPSPAQKRPHSTGLRHRKYSEKQEAHIPPTPVYDKLFESPVPPPERSLPGPPQYGRLQSEEDETPLPESATYERLHSSQKSRGGRVSEPLPDSAVYERLHSSQKSRGGGVPDAAAYGRMHSPPDASADVPETEKVKTATDSPAFFMTQVNCKYRRLPVQARVAATEFKDFSQNNNLIQTIVKIMYKQMRFKLLRLNRC